MDIPPETLQAFIERTAATMDTLAATDPFLPFYLYAEEGSIEPDVYDKLACERYKITKDDPRRAAFVAWAVCDKARKDGHTYVGLEPFVDIVMRTCAIDRPRAIIALNAAIGNGALLGARDDKKRPCVGLSSLVDAEQRIARSIADRLQGAAPESSQLPLPIVENPE